MDDPSALAQSRIARMTRPILAARPFAVADHPRWLGRALSGDILDEVVRRAGFKALSRHTTFRHEITCDEVMALGAEALISGTLKASALSISLKRVGAEIQTLTLPVEGNDAFQRTADRASDWIIASLGGLIDLPGPDTPSPRRAAEPGSYVKLLEAIEQLWTFTAEGNAAALRLAEDAGEADPADAVPQALRAMLLTRAYRSGWLPDRETVAREVESALNAAFARWSGEPVLYWTSAFAEAMLLRRYPVAAKLIRTAVDMQPHNTPALTWGALFLSYDIEFDQAEAMARQALALSPQDPMRVTQGFAGALAAIHAFRDRSALEFCDLVLAEKPNMINALRIRAVALFHLGRVDAAREVMQQILTIDPQESVHLIERVNPLREWPGFARYLEGLKGSGMPLGEAG